MMIIKYRVMSCLVLLIVGIAACKKVPYQKDVLDYYPKVATTSVSIEPDGSARVTGNVISSGSGDLYYVGFCMGTEPHPQMHSNQKLVNTLSGTTFTDTFSNLDALERYYVRSFAANEFGYAYGEDLVIEKAGMDTNSFPCHPGANTIMTETVSSTKLDQLSHIEVLDSITHEVSVSSSTYSLKLHLEFGKTPLTGKYLIWDHVERGASQVSILFSDPNLGTYAMENGGYIYVQQVDATRIRVWICHQEAITGKYITAGFTTK